MIRTAGGEQLGLVCYAFTANKYRQLGRPADEHRFQIKYGSEFHRYHTLYFDRTGRKTTLMFGVHLEMDLFVAVDPRMHSPTWFSSSVEFKTGDLEEAARTGWHGWERERSDARRKQARPEETLLTESVVAFRPEQFARYVEFERLASGLDCGERLVLSDRIERALAAGDVDRAVVVEPHALELQLGIPAAEILNVITSQFRLAAAVRGGVAEYHLERYLRGLPDVRKVHHIIEDGKPDFEIEYRRELFLIECKNVLRHLYAKRPKVDFQKTRAAKGDPCSRYYKPTQFDVLAACLHPVTQTWEFRFAPTSGLSPHLTCPGRLSPNVPVAETWPSDLRVLLDAM
jgi:Methylase-associated X1